MASDVATAVQTGIIISTSAVSFISGFLLAVYATRGYIIPPSWTAERRRKLNDPVESDESDVDEADTILDHAPNWANGFEADRRDGLRTRVGGGGAGSGDGSGGGGSGGGGEKKSRVDVGSDDSAPHTELYAGDPDEECKLVMAVRTDLGMTKGKMAAQCSHATLACYKFLSRAARISPASPAARLLRRWEAGGQAKIAVQVKSEEELMALQRRAQEVGVLARVIADAGRTQIESGSLTVLGVGPAPKSRVDMVTGDLKLL